MLVTLSMGGHFSDCHSQEELVLRLEQRGFLHTTAVKEVMRRLDRRDFVVEPEKSLQGLYDNSPGTI
jgi:hypothetical protein